MITRKQASELYTLFSQNNMQEPKLNFVFQQNIKRLKPIVEATNDLIEEERLAHVSVDEKGNTIVEGGSYKYTPQKLSELTKKLKAINSQEVEFTPYKFSKENQKLEQFGLFGNDFLAFYSEIFLDND